MNLKEFRGRFEKGILSALLLLTVLKANFSILTCSAYHCRLAPIFCVISTLCYEDIALQYQAQTQQFTILYFKFKKTALDIIQGY